MNLSFQEKIYSIVRRIPKGKTLTYKEVAFLVGSPKAYRAVGNILNKNYNPQIPCHRVIRSDGKIGGYNRGRNRKISLLKSEGVVIRRLKVVRCQLVLSQEGQRYVRDIGNCLQ